MKKIGILKALMLCSRYKKMSESQKAEIRTRRLREMVSFAKANSPYYGKSFKDVADSFRLTDLPTVNKVELMAHFDDWVTDRGVRLADVKTFMGDLDNVGRMFRGEYLVFTTSGSTGNPLVMLCDKTTNNVMGGISAGRGFARKSDLRTFLKRGGKTMGVFATGGFYLGNSSVRARLLATPWKRKQMGVTSSLLPVSKIVEELNAFRPAMLGGYPTALELLIDEQKAGRLRIRPMIIMTGGEYLSEDLRKRLEEAFGCYVQTAYACTEGGTIACECTEHHFHINDDWIIVEPVDAHNRPVPDGVQSDKILLTNLYNFTQPFIRYEVTDRVVMHHEPCPCGNPSPWLTLEGRTDDIVSFTEDGREIKIPPLSLYAKLKEVHGIQRFQLIAHRGNQVELRLIPSEGFDRAQAFDRAKEVLEGFLQTHGVRNLDISLSPEEPQQHPQSGKFKHIINAKDT